MTVDERIMNRYALSNYGLAPFQKLFDVSQPHLQNPADLLSPGKRFPFQFGPYPLNFQNSVAELSKFNGNPLWKSPNSYQQSGLPYFPLGHSQLYPPIKYFPPPPSNSMDLLNNYLQGPSPDMVKYIDKIREIEIATKMKDNIEAKLCEEDLWKRFNNLTTEMVITKSGR